MKEQIIDTKKCTQCDASFDITDRDIEFYRQVSPVVAGVKHQIPAPEKCPDCRMQNRMSFRNERKLFKRKCNATGKEIISMYSPKNDHNVYQLDMWMSDNWDALDYGFDTDFSEPIFPQIHKLIKQVPLPGLYSYYGTNSDYCNCVSYQKDCYLTFASTNDEGCMYGHYINHSNNIVDGLMVFDSENCYECVDCIKGYNLKYCVDCKDSRDCFYSVGLLNCQNCFGCTNLVGKSYCFENKQLTKEQYQEEIKDITNYQIPDRGFAKSMSGDHNENSSGNYISNTKNSHFCFDGNNLEDCKYTIWFYDAKNCHDIYSFGGETENCYECVAMGDTASNVIFSANVSINSSDVMYCMFCIGAKHCFGCVGLKNKEYCIFNKQYTKEEYQALVPKIIKHMQNSGEWGNTFPKSLSTFPYADTIAADNYILTKQEALDKGFHWSDYEVPFPKVEKTIPASKLPQDISEVPDDILNWAVECEVTKKPFRIIKSELEFYRKHKFPIPKRHPDQRHLDRMNLRNPRKLYQRECEKCNVDISTTYSPDRSESIYCEECYNQKVY